MITKTATRRLITVTIGALLTLAATIGNAFAYPAPDGGDAGGGVPQGPTPTSPATSSGSSLWVFLLVIAVTAAIAVLATLTVVRMRHHGAVAAH